MLASCSLGNPGLYESNNVLGPHSSNIFNPIFCLFDIRHNTIPCHWVIQFTEHRKAPKQLCLSQEHMSLHYIIISKSFNCFIWQGTCLRQAFWIVIAHRCEMKCTMLFIAGMSKCVTLKALWRINPIRCCLKYQQDSHTEGLLWQEVH